MKFKWLNHSKIARSISLSKYETTLTPFPASHQKIILNTTPFNAAVLWHQWAYSFSGAWCSLPNIFWIKFNATSFTFCGLFDTIAVTPYWWNNQTNEHLSVGLKSPPTYATVKYVNFWVKHGPNWLFWWGQFTPTKWSKFAPTNRGQFQRFFQVKSIFY